jgi:hypothetical protein
MNFCAGEATACHSVDAILNLTKAFDAVFAFNESGCI